MLLIRGHNWPPRACVGYLFVSSRRSIRMCALHAVEVVEPDLPQLESLWMPSLREWRDMDDDSSILRHKKAPGVFAIRHSGKASRALFRSPIGTCGGVPRSSN